MADGDGIGGGGTLPDDRSVKSGLDYVTATAARDLTWQPGDVFKGATQRASAQLTGEFHVYREPAGSDGTEVYLVAFIGDGLFSPHASGRQIMSDEVLTGHDRNDRDPALGKGFFHYRADVSVKPNPTRQPISWVCTAPTTEKSCGICRHNYEYLYTFPGDGCVCTEEGRSPICANCSMEVQRCPYCREDMGEARLEGRLNEMTGAFAGAAGIGLPEDAHLDNWFNAMDEEEDANEEAEHAEEAEQELQHEEQEQHNH